jgi:tetratricopeptide (TPR) repeat protein
MASIKEVFKKTSILIGVILLIFLIVYSLLLPKNQFQQAKEHLVKNPNDFEAHLILAEEFLKNNQFEKAEKELLMAQTQEPNSKLEKLWQKKHYSDPKDIEKLIQAWEEILFEKPDYRDAYLNLAWLHHQNYKDQKAKENLEKAIALDPNFEPTLKLQKIIN